ncbi:MAG: NYN domain-containing protein [Armatimonadetes bacterium]|nr:NYN domain-containing protein [Armatimonadota bacterium]
MSDRSLCRIGVFYDGSYFTYARRHFYFDRKIGWLDFRPFHGLLENYVRAREQGYTHYRVVYGAWFQGMFGVSQAEEKQLRSDRNLYHDLMHAGIDPKFIPMPQSGSGEKGADVALAIDAMQIGLEGKVDIAVLVTGDADFVPLARALMKQSVRVMAAYFQYDRGEHRGFINERLLNVCNYSINVNAMETDKDFRAIFKGLFRRADEGRPE